MKDIIVNIDMDGVIARWNTEASLEDTYKPGYFLRREIEPVMAEVIDGMEMRRWRYRFLSSVYTQGHAWNDKEKWLYDLYYNHLRHIDSMPDEIPHLFVPYGSNKSEWIGEGPQVLLDDYTRNLKEWEASGNVGVKFMNGINGTHGTWNGFTVSRKMDAEHILAVLDTAKRFAEERGK